MKQEKSSNKKTRGEAARAALMSAGLSLFGEFGLTATTTRMLCREAQVNISSISYYFGSKEGLYKAVLGHVAETMSAYTRSFREQAQRMLEKDSLSKEEAMAGFQDLLASYTDLFLNPNSLLVFSKIIVKEQIAPTDGFKILYDRYMYPALAQITQFIALLTGLPPTHPENKIRAQTFLGQLLGFYIARETLLQHLGVASLDQSHVALIKSVLHDNIRACLEYQSKAGA